MQEFLNRWLEVQHPAPLCHRPLQALALAIVVVLCFTLPPQQATAQGNNVKLETLRRMAALNIDANPTLKDRVVTILGEFEGQPEYIELVPKLKLTGLEAELLTAIVAHPNDPNAVNAIRYLLAGDATTLLRTRLEKGNADAGSLVDLLGNVAHPEAIQLLYTMVQRPAGPSRNDFGARIRRSAVQALANSRQGAAQLLELAEDGILPPDLRLTTAAALHQVRWETIREKAKTVLPAPVSASMTPLPPIAELLKMDGDPKRGRDVFFRPTTLCASCHQVRGQGIDFGPALSEIGDKLGKDALYESILDPSAGISFDYETWELEFDTGEEAFGIIVSETEDILAVKAQNGVVTRYPKASVTRRDKQPRSVMPEGLQATMTQQDLVDLVTYLATLKKSPAAPPSESNKP